MTVDVSVCTACTKAFFPAPRACHACGSNHFSTRTVNAGSVEEATEVERGTRGAGPVVIGCVRTDAGPVVVARFGDLPQPGDRVELTLDDRVLKAQLIENETKGVDSCR